MINSEHMRIIGEKLNQKAEEIKQIYEDSVKKILDYRQEGVCKENDFPIQTYCMHHSNSQGNEGIVLRLHVGVVSAEIVGEKHQVLGPLRKIEYKIRNMEGFSEFQFYGYGEKWKKLRRDTTFLKMGKCGESLSLPENVTICRLKEIEVGKFLELKPFIDSFEHEKPRLYIS